MTSNALFPRFLPVILFFSFGFLSFLLNFNGLYGQDAHEYLRQSRVIFDRFQGMPVPAQSLGDTEFAGGYPLAGALLRFLLGDSVLALQVVSWLAAALGLLVFERLLCLLAPGARAESRWVFAGLGLALAPMFFRAGLTSMSDGLGLMFALTAFYFALRAFEKISTYNIIYTVGFAALAVTTRYSLGALLLPLGVSLAYFLIFRKKTLDLAIGLGLGCLAFLPHFWLKSGIAENPFGHSMLQHWSVANFFQHSFNNENGFSDYTLPNILFLLFPLMHPAFCLALPGLFFLFKKTDLALPAKKTLLICISSYLILLGGMPHQNPRHLLPAYVLLLLLLFPAWDRLYCYGFLFFRRLTTGILATAFALQVICCVWILAPILARHRLEQVVAATLSEVMPPKSTLYAFDLDVAMHSYLPNIQIQNLWERQYAEFPSGSYVLFNEALRPQWQGQHPMLNWDFLKENYRLKMRAKLPEGWALWEIE